MATLKDIQRRIRTVEKTQKITSAMRMVSAAKLRRAQDAILAARPYAQRMYAVLGEIGRRQKEAVHPLLEPRPQRRVLELVVVTSDRGLCGAFNNSILKTAQRELRQRAQDYDRVLVTQIGRKADEFFRRRVPDDMPKRWTGIATVEYSHATEIAEHLAKRYVTGEIDGSIVIYNEFVSAMTQTPRVDPLLPLVPEAEIEAAGEAAGDAAIPFEIEPDAKSLLDILVPQALEFSIYRVLLENQAGEHAARMTAMESATRNTEELIEKLTLQYNRARQAAITKELVEIVSGGEAGG
jgi:F-type H+-transporting ATPase subunit gamma